MDLKWGASFNHCDLATEFPVGVKGLDLADELAALGHHSADHDVTVGLFEHVVIVHHLNILAVSEVKPDIDLDGGFIDLKRVGVDVMGVACLGRLGQKVAV